MGANAEVKAKTAKTVKSGWWKKKDLTPFIVCDYITCNMKGIFEVKRLRWRSLLFADRERRLEDAENRY